MNADVFILDGHRIAGGGFVNFAASSLKRGPWPARQPAPVRVEARPPPSARQPCATLSRASCRRCRLRRPPNAA